MKIYIWLLCTVLLIGKSVAEPYQAAVDFLETNRVSSDLVPTANYISIYQEIDQVPDPKTKFGCLVFSVARHQKKLLTPDQAKATGDVKEDMQLSHPMDRLVCGDVGFGKTEVAIRAAFKAVVDNKQVAVLVPTTILAMQHHRTFSERLANFPVKVEYINRFKSNKEIKETLKRVESGETNIFKILGL